jgi:electron transport complex protein RnfD
MATDYVTSPVTRIGQILFGIGCGVVTILIRYFGGYNEGVSYAILVMNGFVVLLDRLGRPVKFGAPKKEAGKK